MITGANPKGMLYGVPVYVVPTTAVPRRKLSESVPVSDYFRDTFNDWLRGFFGVDHVSIVKDGEVLKLGDALFMRESTLRRITVEINKRGAA